MDLHIHIGRTNTGRSVKITASRNLTLMSVLNEALYRKGLDIVGIIDTHSPDVLKEILDLVTTGRAIEVEGGGVLYDKSLLLLLGTELEIYDEQCKGPIHVLCFLPTIEAMSKFSSWCEKRLKNIHLSSQRIYTSGKELQRKVKELEGIFIPAHIFTPFKSLYGKGVDYSLVEVFEPTLIDAVELGLSADTSMAVQIKELDRYSFVTNSDAHSSVKIAREHQVVQLDHVNFTEVKKTILGEQGKIVKNVGLHPRLGKYFQTVCGKCLSKMEKDNVCRCGSTSYIKGVSERVKEIATLQALKYRHEHTHKSSRPPYVHQVPLQFIRGCGPKTLDKLLSHFGNEMVVLHEAPVEDLKKVVPSNIANNIIKARLGKLEFEEGGGGVYGKVK
nr:endonuclease Q family protein [Evansella cellulosilytica]